MNLEYEVTIDDLVAYQEHVAFSRYRRHARLRAFFRGVFGFAGSSLLFYTQVKSVAASAVVGVTVGLVFGLAWTSVERDQLRKAIRRMYRDASDPAMGRQRLVLEPGGIKTSSSAGSSELTWQAVSRVDMNDSHCFIHLGPAKAIVVPLSFVDSRDELKSVLKSCVHADRLQGLRGNAGG